MSTIQDKLHIQIVTDLLSENRLGELVRITGSHERAIEFHQQSLKLGTSLMNIIATVEIALRNAIKQNLNTHFGNENWLGQQPSLTIWRQQEINKIGKAIEDTKRVKYAKLNQSEKDRLYRVEYPSGSHPPNLPYKQRMINMQRHISITDIDIIPALTFNYWKRLYSRTYEPTLWYTSLQNTFPNTQMSRPIVESSLEIIHIARNRLAHHEPVQGVRFGDTIRAIIVICKNLGTNRQNSEGALFTLLEEDIKKIRKNERAYSKKLNAYK